MSKLLDVVAVFVVAAVMLFLIVSVAAFIFLTLWNYWTDMWPVLAVVGGICVVWWAFERLDEILDRKNPF